MAQVATTVGEGWQRFAALADGSSAPVVLATARDLTAAGFMQLDEGVFLLGTGSNGVTQTMFAMCALTGGLMQLAAWGYRLPRPGWAPEQYEGSGGPTADAAAGANAEAEAVGRRVGGLTLADAHRTPHLYLLAIGTFGLGITGLPFLINAKFLLNDVFGGCALPAATLVGASATFPSLLSAANLSGRFIWGPMSDRSRHLGAYLGAYLGDDSWR